MTWIIAGLVILVLVVVVAITFERRKKLPPGKTPPFLVRIPTRGGDGRKMDYLPLGCFSEGAPLTVEISRYEHFLDVCDAEGLPAACLFPYELDEGDDPDVPLPAPVGLHKKLKGGTIHLTVSAKKDDSSVFIVDFSYQKN